MGCRSAYYKTKPVSPNLELGRQKGTNHLEGIPKSKASNIKRSKTHKKFWKEHPELLKERGKKIRGENHYQWKGGITRLSLSIRQMTENRKWMDATKARDKKCLICGAIEELESHHIKEVAKIIEENNIKNREDARKCKELWDINNGITVCAKCHCKIHNRKYNKKGNGRRQKYDNDN
jgi:hypothetical protein